MHGNKTHREKRKNKICEKISMVQLVIGHSSSNLLVFIKLQLYKDKNI